MNKSVVESDVLILILSIFRKYSDQAKIAMNLLVCMALVFACGQIGRNQDAQQKESGLHFFHAQKALISNWSGLEKKGSLRTDASIGRLISLCPDSECFAVRPIFLSVCCASVDTIVVGVLGNKERCERGPPTVA